ncbi:hypothetical protein G7Y89_g1206 [Cudoniella acicularis]|uniref:Uncharacterized protein n=1 Tax=Cudoniella acicularis TaxID=354080 RepID=A0A8H4RWU0_9HELO|nr:hypothetical protein G7Y89_g1206 [Cudoniella acicularis]
MYASPAVKIPKRKIGCDSSEMSNQMLSPCASNFGVFQKCEVGLANLHHKRQRPNQSHYRPVNRESRANAAPGNSSNTSCESFYAHPNPLTRGIPEQSNFSDNLFDSLLSETPTRSSVATMVRSNSAARDSRLKGSSNAYSGRRPVPGDNPLRLASTLRTTTTSRESDNAWNIQGQRNEQSAGNIVSEDYPSGITGDCITRDGVSFLISYDQVPGDMSVPEHTISTQHATNSQQDILTLLETNTENFGDRALPISFDASDDLISNIDLSHHSWLDRNDQVLSNNASVTDANQASSSSNRASALAESPHYGFDVPRPHASSRDTGLFDPGLSQFGTESKDPYTLESHPDTTRAINFVDFDGDTQINYLSPVSALDIPSFSTTWESSFPTQATRNYPNIALPLQVTEDPVSLFSGEGGDDFVEVGFTAANTNSIMSSTRVQNQPIATQAQNYKQHLRRQRLLLRSSISRPQFTDLSQLGSIYPSMSGVSSSGLDTAANDGAIANSGPLGNPPNIIESDDINSSQATFGFGPASQIYKSPKTAVTSKHQISSSPGPILTLKENTNDTQQETQDILAKANQLSKFKGSGSAGNSPPRKAPISWEHQILVPNKFVEAPRGTPTEASVDKKVSGRKGPLEEDKRERAKEIRRLGSCLRLQYCRYLYILYKGRIFAPDKQDLRQGSSERFYEYFPTRTLVTDVVTKASYFTNIYAPPLGITDFKQDLKQKLTDYIDRIISTERNFGEVIYGEMSQLVWDIYEAYFMTTSITILRDSAQELLDSLPRPHLYDYTHNPYMLRLVNNQIKHVMRDLVEKAYLDVLDTLELSLRQKAPAQWAPSFCCIMVLCMCAEMVQTTSDFRIVKLLSDARSSPPSREESIAVCRKLDDVPIASCMSIFHQVYTACKLKDGAKREGGFNPVRQGVDVVMKAELGQDVQDLVTRIKTIAMERGNDLEQQAATPSFNSNLDPVAAFDNHKVFRKRNSGRLVAKFLISML